jgi:MGT family glycosyltransferase
MHVVFFNVLGSGHVNPTLPVVRALVERGDQVTYFTYPDRKADVEAAGAAFHNYGRDDFRVADFHPDGVFPTQLFPAAVGLLPYLLERLEVLKPDRIVADISAPWGAAAARVLGIPLVGSVCTFAFGRALLAEMRRTVNMEMDAVNEAAFASLRDKWQLEFEADDFPMFFAEQNVVYTGRLFNPDLADRSEKFEFVGPMIEPRPDDSGFPTEHYATSTKKCVFVSMGSILGSMRGLGQSFYQPFFDALGERDDVEVVLSLGRTVDPAGFDAPKNFRLESFVPQLELLPHVDAFVTHGGMNSTNEALYYGVPLIVVPFFGDQPVIAQRVEERGAGLVMDHSALTSSAVATNVDRLLNEPRYRAGAAEIQADLRAGSGVAGVLALL